MKPNTLNPHQYPDFKPNENGEYLVIDKSGTIYVETWYEGNWLTVNSNITYFYSPMLYDKSIKPKINYVDTRISYYGC